jgi:hypothetical protein
MNQKTTDASKKCIQKYQRGSLSLRTKGESILVYTYAHHHLDSINHSFPTSTTSNAVKKKKNERLGGKVRK